MSGARRRLWRMVLVGLVVVTATSVALVSNETVQRRALSVFLSAWSGATVSFNGTVSFSLSKDPSLTARDVIINSADGVLDAHIGKLDLQFSLASLFSDRTVIHRFDADDADIRIITDPPAKTARRPYAELRIPQIDHVQLNRIDIVLLAQQRADSYTIGFSDLSATRQAQDGALNITGHGNFNGKSADIRGTISPGHMLPEGTIPASIDLSVAMPEFRFSIAGDIENIIKGQGLDLALVIDMPQAGRFGEFIGAGYAKFEQLHLQGRILGDLMAPQLHELQFDIAGAGVRLSARGRVQDLYRLTGIDAGIEGEVSSAAILGRLPVLSDIPGDKSLVFRGRLTDTGEQLFIKELDALLKTAGKVHVTASGNLIVDRTGERAIRGVDLAMKLEAPSSKLFTKILDAELPEIGGVSGTARLAGETGQFTLEDFRLQLGDSASASVTMRGRVTGLGGNRQRASLDITVEATRPENVMAVADPGRLPAGPIRVDGKLELDQDSQSFAGKVVVGTSEFRLHLTIKEADGRRYIAGSIESPHLIISDLEPRPVKDSVKPALAETQAEPRYVFTEQTLDLSWLTVLDADLDISIEKLTGKTFSLDKLQARVRLADGRLDLDPVKVLYAGGEMAIDVMIDAQSSPPRLAFKARGDDLDIAGLMRQFGRDPLLEGRLSLHVDINGTGQSLRQFVAGVDGQIELALENGRINGADLNLMSADTLSLLLAVATRKGHTDFECLILRWGLEQGIATIQALLIKTDKMNIAGKGQVDLQTEQVDVVLTADPDAFISPGFKRPLHIQGTLAKPAVAKDTSSVGKITKGIGLLTGLSLISVPQLYSSIRAAGMLTSLLSEGDEDSPCIEQDSKGVD